MFEDILDMLSNSNFQRCLDILEHIYFK